MKPVDQQVFGSPDGDCLMASAASILEVPLEALPAFRGEEEHWWDRLQEALRPHGFTAIYYPHDPDGGYQPIAPRGYHIASGRASRGYMHAVVYQDGKLAHDPHPSREGIYEVRAYYLIVPLAESA